MMESPVMDQHLGQKQATVSILRRTTKRKQPLAVATEDDEMKVSAIYVTRLSPTPSAKLQPAPGQRKSRASVNKGLSAKRSVVEPPSFVTSSTLPQNGTSSTSASIRSSAAEPLQLNSEMKSNRSTRTPKNSLETRKERVRKQCMEEVSERLLAFGHCDVERLLCQLGGCGRRFGSARVLAWHMSYSHTDVESKTDAHRRCLVCDHAMNTVKGKMSHLVSAHKELASAHNVQCVEFRETWDPARSFSTETFCAQPYLLNDELDFDEDLDFYEDVSIVDDVCTNAIRHHRNANSLLDQPHSQVVTCVNRLLPSVAPPTLPPMNRYIPPGISARSGLTRSN